MPKKLTQEEFLAKAVAVHGVSRYDYSQTVYLPMPQKIAIRCPEHGEFLQPAAAHLFGKGCPLCANKTKALKAQQAVRKWNTDTVREKAKRLHPTLDFNEFEYAQYETKSIVICPIHGKFNKSAHELFLKRGCSECHLSTIGQWNRKGREYHIALFKIRHGDRYSYSLAPDLIRNTDKITITCKEHGHFRQLVDAHQRGQGCPKCSYLDSQKSWIERAAGRICTLYFLHFHNEEESFYKIGVTWLDTKYRYHSRKMTGGYNYEILAEYKSFNATAIFDWEQAIIETFSGIHYKPKIYFGGCETECFSSCDEILAIFPL